MAKLHNVQVLRGVAAVLVAAHHFLLSSRDAGFGGWADFFSLAEFGASGVDLFFCISGFVMFSSISGRLRLDGYKFIVERFIRIVPMYWIALTLFLALVFVANLAKLGLAGAMAHPWFSVDLVVFSYILFPEYNPASGLVRPILAQGWTLSYELYFYVVLLIACFVGAMNIVRVWLFTAALLLVGIFVGSLFVPRSGAVADFFSNPICLEFLLGMGVFLLSRKTRVAAKFSLVLGCSLILLTVFFGVADRERFFFWGVPSAMILYGVVSLEGCWVNRSFLIKIGDASYSLYLVHGFLVYVYTGLLKQGYFLSEMQKNIAVIFGVALSVLLSILCYRLIESSIIVFLRNRWIYSRLEKSV